MLKLSACFLFSLFMLMACNNSSNSISNVKTDSLVALPFFNAPDWTPEWINKEDSGYARIHSIPSFSFKDQEGKNFTEANVEGKIYVANFFYTKCRGICPKMTTNMSLLQEAFKNDSTIVLLSHSVTPELDSIAVLKKYAILNKVDSKKWHLLTGDKNEIYALAKQQYFALGQRWISDTETDLGLGTIVVIEARTVTVLYPATGESRVYAAQTAPLTRIEFEIGDNVKSHEGWELLVEQVQEKDNQLIYIGHRIDNNQAVTLKETFIDHDYGIYKMTSLSSVTKPILAKCLVICLWLENQWMV